MQKSLREIYVCARSKTRKSVKLTTDLCAMNDAIEIHQFKMMKSLIGYDELQSIGPKRRTDFR